MLVDKQQDISVQKCRRNHVFTLLGWAGILKPPKYIGDPFSRFIFIHHSERTTPYAID